MQLIHSLEALRETIGAWRRAGLSIGFVPTMGNLHAGHISLLTAAKARTDRTVVSIFVNPIQFGKGEDYARYPSTLPADAEKLTEAGLDVLFAPDLAALYPSGFEQHLRVVVPELDHILCGAFRPGHFSGVATVVAKLFVNVQPDIAFFGEKDYQQVLVVQRLVEELCLPIQVLAMPVVREADGLAMSSRNQYLSLTERARAATIFQSLLSAHAAVTAGATLEVVEAEGMRGLESAGFRPEYFSVRRALDLKPPLAEDSELRILVAAWLGAARLIDNLAVTRPRSAT